MESRKHPNWTEKHEALLMLVIALASLALAGAKVFKP